MVLNEVWTELAIFRILSATEAMMIFLENSLQLSSKYFGYHQVFTWSFSIGEKVVLLFECSLLQNQKK